MIDSFDRRIREIVDGHIDPRDGSPYWIERSRERGIEPGEIRERDDLARFGTMDGAALEKRPLGDFIPRRFLSDRRPLILAETGGTLGKNRRTVYTEEEFRNAFIDPWCRAARMAGMEAGLSWLYVGPGAPHIIGVASRAYARALGSRDPFAVGVDARWIRKFAPHTHGFKSYLLHILDQARALLDLERISAIFTTPPLLAALADIMTAEERGAVRAVHLGGMRLDQSLFIRLRNELFPQATILPGYGNSLFGVAPAVHEGPDHLDYFPDGTRVLFRLVADGEAQEGEVPRDVDYGETGRLLFHRLDESFMMVNCLERDQGGRLPPSKRAMSIGLGCDGIRDPAPLSIYSDAASAGVY